MRYFDQLLAWKDKNPNRDHGIMCAEYLQQGRDMKNSYLVVALVMLSACSARPATSHHPASNIEECAHCQPVERFDLNLTQLRPR